MANADKDEEGSTIPTRTMGDPQAAPMVPVDEGSLKPNQQQRGKRKDAEEQGEMYIQSILKSALSKTQDDPLVVDLWTLRNKTITVGATGWKFVVRQDPDEILAAEDDKVTTAVSMTASCNLCGVREFEGGVQEQRAHFKSRWHLVNQRLKGKGKPPVTEDDANDYAASSSSDSDDEEAAGEESEEYISSSTSSEDEDDQEAAMERMKEMVIASEKRATKTDIELEGGLTVAMYTAVAKSSTEVQSILIPQANAPQVWGIILYQSGHFASAIFRDGKLVKHQTEHRYTQRKKQGGSQAAHDTKGSKAKSAGAMLRRYGEQSMQEKVRLVLEQWDWEQCTRIYFAVPERARKLFLLSGRKHKSKERKESRFSRHDPKVRKVPFMTARPTLGECERVFHVLSQVEFFKTPPPPSVVETAMHPSKQSDDSEKKKKLSEAELAQLEKAKEVEKYRLMGYEDLPIHQAAKEDNVELVRHAIKDLKNEVDAPAMDGDTPLHLASQYASLGVLKELLEQGADLTKKDLLGRVPYQRAKDPAIRTVLREFRGDMGEEYTDWKLTLVPEPPKAKSEEELQRKKEREKEKKKRQAERKKLEKQQQQEEMERKQKELALQAQLPLDQQCAECKKALPPKKKDRFSQGNDEFCSAACMRNHTRRLAADAAEKRLQSKG